MLCSTVLFELLIVYILGKNFFDNFFEKNESKSSSLRLIGVREMNPNGFFAGKEDEKMATKQEFEALYREHYQLVYYTAVQLMGDVGAGEDMTQEAFITAFLKYDELKNKEVFGSWVKRIVINKCMDELRKRTPIPTEDETIEVLTGQEEDENFLPEEYALQEDKRRIVFSIMGSVLSRKQFETVLLYYYDELPVLEIAQLMGVPEGTVLSRLSAARTKIKKGVLEYEEKNHDKLHSVAILPFLALLFKEDANACVLPPVEIPAEVMEQVCSDAAATGAKAAGAAGKDAAATGAKAAGAAGKDAAATGAKAAGAVGKDAATAVSKAAGVVKTGVVAAKLKIALAAAAAVICIGAGVVGFHYWKKSKPESEKEKELPELGYEVQHEFAYADEDDTDGDGLTNAEERELGTDINLVDTDRDGLSDREEVEKKKTDPCSADTDGDGLDDGIEILAGLNPKEQKSDGDVNDGDVEMSFKKTVDDAVLSVKGSAKAAATIFDVFECSQAKAPGVLSQVYEVILPKEGVTKAILTIPYAGISGKRDYSHFKIYEMKNDGGLKKIGGSFDTEEETVFCEITNSGKYYLADETIVENDADTEILFVIDDSGSMYSKELVGPSMENDPEFKRLEMVRQLVDMMDENTHFMLSTFTGGMSFKIISEPTDETDVTTTDKEEIYKAIETIKTNTEHNFNGTDIDDAMVDATNAATTEESRGRHRYMILLTDGYNEWGLFGQSLHSESEAIKACNEAGITLIVVGLGHNLNVSYLRRLVQNTNGLYVYVEDANAVTQVYDRIMAALTNWYVDLDGNGEMDSILYADNGFDIRKNGWGFNNFYFIPSYNESKVWNGQDEGLAAIAQLKYRGKLPLSADAVEEYESGRLFSKEAAKYAADAYDITENTAFTEAASLYEYSPFPELRTELDKEFWEYRKYDSEDSTHLTYSDKVLEIVKSNPLLTLKKIEIGDGSEGLFCGEKVKAKTADCIVCTTAVSVDDLTEEQKQTYEVLQMIHNFYARQGIDKKFTILKFGELQNSGSRDDLMTLMEWIRDGEAPMLSAKGHTVCALRLYREIDDPMKFMLKVYDPDDNSHEKTVTIRRILRATGSKSKTTQYFYEVIDEEGIFGEKGDIINAEFRLIK